MVILLATCRERDVLDEGRRSDQPLDEMVASHRGRQITSSTNETRSSAPQVSGGLDLQTHRGGLCHFVIALSAIPGHFLNSRNSRSVHLSFISRFRLCRKALREFRTNSV